MERDGSGALISFAYRRKQQISTQTSRKTVFVSPRRESSPRTRMSSSGAISTPKCLFFFRVQGSRARPSLPQQTNPGLANVIYYTLPGCQCPTAHDRFQKHQSSCITASKHKLAGANFKFILQVSNNYFSHILPRPIINFNLSQQ